MKFLTMMMPLVVSGCFYTSLPDLSEPVATKCADVKPLAMPAPIPKTVNLVIEGGKIIKADEGGEQLIRQYAATRKAIRSWGK